jgi:hypothetical protein
VTRLLTLTGNRFRTLSVPGIQITHLMRIADDTTLRRPALRDALTPAWPDIQTAAKERRSRQGHGP